MRQGLKGHIYAAGDFWIRGLLGQNIFCGYTGDLETTLRPVLVF